MARNDRGILLIATTACHLSEAGLCIRSIRKATDLPIAICTPLKPNFPVQVIETPNAAQSYLDKVRYLQASPYERTLFLDTDTLILRPDALEVFDLLDPFDLALAHAPTRQSDGIQVEGIPGCYPEFNTGVIAYQQNRRVKELFRQWEETFRQQLNDHERRGATTTLHDQPSLRIVLYTSAVRLATLPPEYNYRCSPTVRLPAVESIRILHNRRLQRNVLGQNDVINLAHIKTWHRAKRRSSRRR